MHENENPMMEDLYFGSPRTNVEREKPEEFSNSLTPEELVDLVDEPPIKRIHA